MSLDHPFALQNRYAAVRKTTTVKTNAKLRGPSSVFCSTNEAGMSLLILSGIIDVSSFATTPVIDTNNKNSTAIFVFIVLQPPFCFFKKTSAKQFFCQ
ncbi:MAG: hypothetical protein KAR24_02760 [Candidatus Pacebacteria bacterium]|nr:hypothetical protein [Candidatus Paceibacterota bacterium]